MVWGSRETIKAVDIAGSKALAKVESSALEKIQNNPAFDPEKVYNKHLKAFVDREDF